MSYKTRDKLTGFVGVVGALSIILMLIGVGIDNITLMCIALVGLIPSAICSIVLHSDNKSKGIKTPQELKEQVKNERIARDNAPGHLISCSICNKQVSSKAKSCPDCGNPIDTKIYCTKCGSSNTKPISNADKVASTWAWGVYAANKVVSKYKCLDCKHKF